MDVDYISAANCDVHMAMVYILNISFCPLNVFTGQLDTLKALGILNLLQTHCLTILCLGSGVAEFTIDWNTTMIHPI